MRVVISREEVEHIALLSRLKLTDEELDLFTGHLDEILVYCRKIDELDTSDVPPSSHVLPITNVMREEDAAGVSLDVGEALGNAPDKRGDYFRVPKVTE
jgi:aspartyl-tRNA(Asn)/glutamyl-tRNA(Gln) amidotransferase subunit C